MHYFRAHNEWLDACVRALPIALDPRVCAMNTVASVLRDESVEVCVGCTCPIAWWMASWAGGVTPQSAPRVG